MEKFKDEIGKKYGRLTVTKRAAYNNRGSALWECLCECGKTIVVSGSSLRKGHTRSCGCLRDEKARERMTAMRTKHGDSHTKLNRIWRGMKERCYNESNNSYQRYGSRGILVCPEWRDNFNAFRDWALANGYREGLTIERKDNDGHYSPENCCWMTLQKQQENKSTNVKVSIIDTETGTQTVTPTIASASRVTGVNQNTIRRIIQGTPTKEKRYIFKKGE